MKRVVITHGPGYEPIDEARRITNISTGRLGTMLANGCAAAGLDVVAFRGELATHPRACDSVNTRQFTTNADLIDNLKSLDSRESIQFVFHAAALCDYQVADVCSDSGKKINANKIPSSKGNISLILEPSIKVLPQLGEIFPNASIVGWKYELSGDRSDSIQAGVNQIDKVGSAGCVINGKAYGQGFGFLHPDKHLEHFNTVDQLVDWLIRWVISDQETK